MIKVLYLGKFRTCGVPASVAPWVIHRAASLAASEQDGGQHATSSDRRCAENARAAHRRLRRPGRSVGRSPGRRAGGPGGGRRKVPASATAGTLVTGSVYVDTIVPWAQAAGSETSVIPYTCTIG